MVWDSAQPMHAIVAQSHIAQAIYRRMQKAGLSQRELALKAGLNEAYVRDVLRGKSKNPRHNGLVAIASVLNCSILDLIDPTLAKKPVADSEVVYKPEERAWLAFFRALAPSQRERLLLDMIRGAPPMEDDTILGSDRATTR